MKESPMFKFNLTTPESRNKNRLTKIHRLKRENRVLGQKRRGTSNTLYILQNKSELFSADLMINVANIKYWSERIGKNSCKIQRLRTLIKQEKAKEIKSREHNKETFRQQTKILGLGEESIKLMTTNIWKE